MKTANLTGGAAPQNGPLAGSNGEGRFDGPVGDWTVKRRERHAPVVGQYAVKMAHRRETITQAGVKTTHRPEPLRMETPHFKGKSVWHESS